VGRSAHDVDLGKPPAMADTPASWLTYFKNEEFSTDDRRFKLIASLCEFLLGPHGWDFVRHLKYMYRTWLTLEIDFCQLQEASCIPDLQPAVELQPEECLGCLGAAFYEVLAIKMRFLEIGNLRLYY
jgi:hypothetical protein